MSDREWFWSKVIMMVLISFAAAVLALSVTGVLTEDPTCPNYGEVPALIDGGYECIPWEVQP